MNILFFYRVYPNYGGVEVVTSVLAKRFVEDGHQVTIASLEQPHPELKDQNIDGGELVTLHHPVLAKDNIARLHQVIVDKKIDIVVNQWGLPYKTTILCNKAIKGTNCKLVSVLHGAPNISKVIIKAQDKVKNVTNPISKLVYSSILKVKEEVIKWSIRYACKHNEKYIMLSNAFIEPLIKYARIKDSANITAIGNPVTIPVDLSGFDLKNKKKQILYVGRMDFENKRVNRIVEAWEASLIDIRIGNLYWLVMDHIRVCCKNMLPSTILIGLSLKVSRWMLLSAITKMHPSLCLLPIWKALD